MTGCCVCSAGPVLARPCAVGCSPWVLNPATLVFMGFVLGWGFSAIRLVAGLVLVLGVSLIAQRIARPETLPEPAVHALVEASTANEQPFFLRWGKTLWQLFWSTIPVYILAVLLLGAARVWLFPHVDGAMGNSLLWLVPLAIVGTLFVIPTAAEIPIVQTMMTLGLGTAPAVALLMTLPSIADAAQGLRCTGAGDRSGPDHAGRHRQRVGGAGGALTTDSYHRSRAGWRRRP